MMTLARCHGQWLAFCLALAWPGLLSAEVAKEQREQLKQVERDLEKLTKLLRGKKTPNAAALAASIETMFGELKNAEPQADLAPLLAPLEKRFAAAQRLLEAKLPKPATDPKAKPKGAPATPATGVPDKNGFVGGVAPILVAKCSGCHIRDSKGGMSVSTYPALMKGSDAGTVFKPGKSKGSRLMDLLESGDMPRGGGKLSLEEIQTVARWIDAGAKFDGPDETAMLTALVRVSDRPAVPELKVVQASGSESVAFMRDIAPVLVANCTQCHGGRQPASRLSLETFAALLRGTRDGAILSPGKPGESLLVQKLRGTAPQGARMPLQRDPLPEETIQKIEIWITEGARFDGIDAAADLEQALRVIAASKMSHDELASLRSGLADQNWKLGNPEGKAVREETDGFVMLGNFAPFRMNELVAVAKAEQKKIVDLLKLPADKPWMKGRLTLFMFGKRFDYNEYGRMVEKREIPPEMQAHWRANVIDAYACVMLPSPDKEKDELPILLAEQMAGAFIDNLGVTPTWFSVGSARAIAAKAESKSLAATSVFLVTVKLPYHVRK